MTVYVGKAKGGKARALSLTPERRKEISMKGVLAKKEKSKLPRAVCGGEDRKIVFGEIKIQCYVLDDGTRVLTQTSLQTGIGMSNSGPIKSVRRIPALMARLSSKGIDTKDLTLRTNNPIKFILPAGGIGLGLDATILPDICAVLIEADRKRKLNKHQKRFAITAAILQHGWATMGIILLVDRITGYEDFQKANDFGKIIEAFVAKEIRPYIKKFPPEFYEEICRLREIPYDPKSVGWPLYFGHLTNSIIYHRLAPGVLKELKKKSKAERSINNPTLFRFLTEGVGDPKLKDVISKSIAVMKLSENWKDFEVKLDIVLPMLKEPPPKFKQLQMAFDSNYPSGVGI